jgi:hypothetical protein
MAFPTGIALADRAEETAVVEVALGKSWLRAT